MKVEELRVGNIVKALQGVGRVEQIRHTGKHGYGIILEGVYGGGSYIEYCEGIPLTEEVLLKCGLTRKGSFFGMGFLDTIYWYNIENQILYIEYTDSPFSEDEGTRYPVSSPIKYLHTLMNAIYDLTGREVEYEKD